jgi:hypothetical protein
VHDDEILSSLRRAAEARAEGEPAFDPRLERLCGGTLSNEEEAALRAELAALPGGEEALAAFTPLGGGFEDQLVVRLGAELLSKQTAPPIAEAKPDAVLIPLRPGRSRVRNLVVVAVPLAAAATIALVFAWPRTAYAPLPEYALTVNAGTKTLRGADKVQPTTPSFNNGSTIVLVLRPATAVNGPFETAAYAVSTGTGVVSLPMKIELDERGAARFSGVLGVSLRLSPGEWTVFVAIGRPGALPTAQELGAAVDADMTFPRGDGYILQSAKIRIEE